MRISDWSSDVCSSDLQTCRGKVHEPVAVAAAEHRRLERPAPGHPGREVGACPQDHAELRRDAAPEVVVVLTAQRSRQDQTLEIGRASCRESGCQYVEHSVVTVTLKNNKKEK